jgi:AraC-like DNA-binding protein
MNSNKIKYLKINKSIMEGIEIKQCIRKEQSYKKHVHKELSIRLIEMGATVVEFGNESYRCSPDDIDQWQFIMVYIDPKYYESKMEFTKVTKIQGEAVSGFLDFITSMSYGMNNMRMEELLIELLIQLENTSKKKTLFEYQSMDESKLLDIKEYIDYHFKEELSLHDLEKMFGINKFTLIRKFKTFFNTTPSAYKLQLKVAEAKKYLDKGVDVFEICEEMGFFDQSHFIREFKKMNGVSPMEYKKIIEEKS